MKKSKELQKKLQIIEKKNLEQINNPKINEYDDYFKKRMILLVHKKSNWHLYYDPKYNSIVSIAVVPGAKSSFFGSVNYFRRWYRWQKRNSKNTMLCLTEKAIEILEKQLNKIAVY